MSAEASMQEVYLRWLSSQASPAQLSELYMVYEEIEQYCRSRKVLKQPLFETTDLKTLSAVRDTIETNHIFRLTHKRSLAKMSNAIRFYITFCKEQGQGTEKAARSDVHQEKLETVADVPETAIVDPLLAKIQQDGIRYVDMRPKGGRLWLLSSFDRDRAKQYEKSGYLFHYAANGSKSTQNQPAWYLVESEEQSAGERKGMPSGAKAPLDSQVRELLKKECVGNQYGTTVTYLCGQIQGAGPVDIKKILDQADWARMDLGRYYYVEAVESKSEQEMPKAKHPAPQVQKLTIDFDHMETYAFTKPKKLTYFGNVIPTKQSWKDVYVQLVSVLYDDYPHVIPVGRSFTGAGRADLGGEELVDSMAAPQKLDGAELFLETNLGATDIVRKCKALLDICNVDYENVVIEYEFTSEMAKRESDKKGQGVEKESAFQGKVQTERMFYRFLRDQANLAERTCRSYVSAILASERFAKKHNYPSGHLLDCDRIEAMTTAQRLLDDPEFIELNRRQHNALSAAIHKFLESIDGLSLTSGQQMGISYQTGETVSVKEEQKRSAFDKTQENEKFMEQVEAEVLRADLDGITLDALAVQIGKSVAYTKVIVGECTSIADIDGRLIHEDAFIDWEGAQAKLDELLTKLVDKNNGYVSASQLYDYAHVEMQMFLNDHGMDKQDCVYALARYLFEKKGYGGKKYAFTGGMHISKQDSEVNTIFDLAKKYSAEHDGFFRPADLAEYFIRTGSSNGTNLYLHMRINKESAFFFYDEEHVMAADVMGIDETWLTQVEGALKRLFDDVGDHITLRSIQPNWYRLLPKLPGGREWTALLLQSILVFHGSRFGCHTVGAANARSVSTLQSMLVADGSEIQNFCDAVAAILIDNGIAQRNFDKDQLRQLLADYGLIGVNQLMGDALLQSISGDPRFAWSADRKRVTITI